ncbi:MAG: hypothetical protein QOE86_3846 [Solirubrobacteraceae bacterium]|jgi:hypothetical protein|nr:hypothetical protein [Solirubrobacteraceae bacterium]
MSESSAPPPGSGTPNRPSPPVVLDLGGSASGMKRLVGGRKEDGRISLTPQEIVVEHPGSLRAPLRFAPGSVLVAAIDPGPASIGREARGRFPILRRIGLDKVIPRSEGIEGWLWTSTDGSAFTVLGDAAPNLAFVFSPPLSGYPIEEAFGPEEIAELAKRSPLGQPAVFGLLVHVAKEELARTTLERYSLLRPVTDREVPPTQRRHLPDDKPANPAIAGAESSHAQTSVPPPGGH